jgi:hypothetical protein
MSEAEARIRAEVDRLLPSPGAFSADWQDVVARADGSRSSRNRRRLILMIAALTAAVVCAGIALGATVLLTRGPDRILTIASGRDWSLVAHRKNGHLCVSYGAPGAEVDSCRLALPRTLSIFTLAPAANGHARLIGLVAPEVTKVETTSPGQKTTTAHIYPLPTFFARRLRLFVQNSATTRSCASHQTNTASTFGSP